MQVKNNLETRKIELHFSKAEFDALTDSQKKELRGRFIWKRSDSCWVSKSVNSHYWPLQVAKNLGFDVDNVERIGERLSFAEEQERKAERAEARADRYLQYADNAEKRGDALQAELNSYSGDIAFFTQPIIAGHAGSQAFARRREKIFNRYFKGFEEYRKGEYYKERAEVAQATADMKKLNDPYYLDNRIKECNAAIKKLQGNVAFLEDILFKKVQDAPISNAYYSQASMAQVSTWLDDALDKLEYEIDKLAYFENALDAVRATRQATGRKLFTPEDIKVGYMIKARLDHWAEVTRVNKKSVTAIYRGHPLEGHAFQPVYAEISEVRIPEGWTGDAEAAVNPFIVGDILTRSNIGGNRIIKAFQVVLTTDKTISIREIQVVDNVPQRDKFVDGHITRRAIKTDFANNYVVNDDSGNWFLYKYSA